MGELFDSRASFELAALVVTWLAVTVLMLIAVNLHVRLQRLERLSPTAQASRPYGRFLGRPMREILGSQATDVSPRLLLFLSNNCSACQRLLEELATGAWSAPVALLWTDGAPDGETRLPRNATIVAEGPKISAALGIRVTPFALVAGGDDRIVEAAPINRLSALGSISGGVIH